jgi:Tol biopolymer transport system component
LVDDGTSSIQISSTRQDYLPVWDNSGTQLAFLSDRTGDVEIWLKGDDGKERKISSFLGAYRPETLNWSPDDQRIITSSIQGQLRIVSMQGDDKVTILPDGMMAHFPIWGSGLDNVFFTSGVGGSQQIWSFDLSNPTKEPIQVTKSGAYASRLYNDGKELVYTKYYNDGLWRFSLDTGIEEQIVETVAVGPRQQWDIIGSDIFYTQSQNGTLVLFKQNIETGARSEQLRFPSRLAYSFSVNPSDKTISYTVPENISRDIIQLQ